MNKNILSYIPTGLNSPETEILLSITQKEINKKNNVTIILCRGGKNYHCSKNIYSIKAICIACINKTNNALSKIKGQYLKLYTPKIKRNDLLENKNFTFTKIINYNYKNCDNGLAAYSSYVDITRDKDIDGFFAKKIIGKLINTSNCLSDFYYEILKKKYHKIYMFNGRMNTYRPLLRVASILKKNIHNLEFNGSRNQIFDFENSLPIDQNYIANKINKFWKNNKKKKIYLIDVHIKKMIKYQSLMHSSLFRIKQKFKKLPKEWNIRKRNIVYFCSSGDESLTGGKTYFFNIFKDQVESIEYIYKKIKKIDRFKKIDFWIRMHPRMIGFKWPFLNNLYNLKKKYPDLNLIYPESDCSSYEMLKKSSLVISPVSSLSIEALHFKKPSINFQKQPFVLLKGSYFPMNKMELTNLIFNKQLKPRSILAQKKFHLFYLDGGFKSSDIKGNFNKNGYFYKNEKIGFGYGYKIIYDYGKIIEKFFYNLFNFLFYFLIKLKKKNTF
jgi:hypothetical protein